LAINSNFKGYFFSFFSVETPTYFLHTPVHIRFETEYSIIFYLGDIFVVYPINFLPGGAFSGILLGSGKTSPLQTSDLAKSDVSDIRFFVLVFFGQWYKNLFDSGTKDLCLQYWSGLTFENFYQQLFVRIRAVLPTLSAESGGVCQPGIHTQLDEVKKLDFRERQSVAPAV